MKLIWKFAKYQEIIDGKIKGEFLFASSAGENRTIFGILQNRVKVV